MKQHCCPEMAAAVARTCDEHLDRFTCPDCLISHSPQSDEYGIIVHDGGTSVVVIQFCPWCGSRLPLSKRTESHEAEQGGTKA